VACFDRCFAPAIDGLGGLPKGVGGLIFLGFVYCFVLAGNCSHHRLSGMDSGSISHHR
jgi:hypothetical protein